MNAKLFRCRICGDPYIGVSLSSRCPFCGAPSKYIIDAHDWNTSEFDVELSETTRKNLQTALQLELSNTAFYVCAGNSAKAAGDEYMQTMFKALMKTEREHASSICKFLKISVPELETSSCQVDAVANSTEGHQRETRAVSSYARFRDEAVEPRMKEFFSALVEIESDHIDMHAAHASL